MLSIELFHSYNYINCKYMIKDTYIYSKNNELLFNVINVPKNRDLYRLKITNILSKKKFSHKYLNIGTNYYTKHNLKIFIEINYKKLYNMVNNSKLIPDNDRLFRLLKSNYIKPINSNKYLIDTICINWGFKKKIKKMDKNNSIKLNFNRIQFYNLEFNCNTNSIHILDNNNKNKKTSVNIKGGIFLCDLKNKSINEFSKYLKLQQNKSLIIVDNERDYKIWETNKISDSLNIDINLITDISDFNKPINKVYYRLLAFTYNSNYLKFIKNLYNNSILWVIINKLNTIKNGELIDYYNIIYDMNLDTHIINEDTIVSIMKSICYRNYKLEMIKTKMLCINSINSINPINYKNIDLWRFNLFQFDTIIKSNTKCSICYQLFTKFNLCKLNCSHYYCVDCVNKILKFNNSKSFIKCPICRENSNIVIKLEDNYTNLFDLSNKYHIHSTISRMIHLIKTNNFKHLIIVQPNQFTFIKHLFSFVKITNDLHQYQHQYQYQYQYQYQQICNKYKMNNIKKINIFLIGDKHLFDISTIIDNIISNKIIINYIDF